MPFAAQRETLLSFLTDSSYSLVYSEKSGYTQEGRVISAIPGTYPSCQRRRDERDKSALYINPHSTARLVWATTRVAPTGKTSGEGGINARKRQEAVPDWFVWLAADAGNCL